MATLAPAPDITTRSDHDLIAGVREGDDQAFATLYRRHHAHVTALVRSMVRDPARSEDIVQEAFVSAFRRMRQTDSEIAFKAWISEIARNASIDHFRRAGRVREMPLDAEFPLAPADAWRVGVTPGPDHAVFGRERFTHFRGALDELNPTHRRMIVLRELEGHSYQEIGQLMDLTPSGVESTLFRARRRLESEYDELHTGARCRTVQSAIRGMAAGTANRRERGRVHRHVRRCTVCARHARMLGVEVEVHGLARAAALLPVPLLVPRPRLGLVDWVRTTVAGGAASGQAAPAVTPLAFDHAGPIAQAVTVMVAAFAIGHGPAAHSEPSRPATPHAALAAPAAATPTPAAVASRPSHGPQAPGRPATPRPARAAASAHPAAPTPQPVEVPRRPATPSPGTPAAHKPATAPATTAAQPSAQAMSEPAQPVTRAGGSASGTLDGLVPAEVTVPGSSTPVLRPREAVSSLKGTLQELTAATQRTIAGR